MPVVTVTTALEIVGQLLQLIQAAHATGGTISQADFDAAVAARDAALATLDADIAAAKARGG